METAENSVAMMLASLDGNLEQGTHDLGEQRTDELQQAEVEQQRQQQGRDDEDDDERGEQVIEDKSALTATGDHTDETHAVLADTQIGEPHEDDREHTDHDPDGFAGEAFLHDVAIHNEFGLCQRNEGHHCRNGEDQHAQQRQEATDDTRDDVGQDLNHNGPFTCCVLDRDHEQDDADD